MNAILYCLIVFGPAAIFVAGCRVGAWWTTRMLTPHWECGTEHRDCDPCPPKAP
jgi:hypothetical protein